ncbi:inositol monophosphatase family protein [Candidatus Pantoea persica]|uniref:inositol monophosphatase family protein n=1 Tax=Candidatus Pantoea persica TaxID=2518128 RepID=UPI00215D96D3|nr:inositol monophosphatase family protein [Candidatus Pantoea persica]MBA2814284.1 histidinol-phosphate aminotransferase [Candidatus Pantoea persica]
MLNIALEAVKMIRPYTVKEFERTKKFTTKADKSIVTQADLTIEKEIRNLLISRKPDSEILGEEFGSKNGEQVSTGWIIDPIDGTRAFLYGVPLFSTLISYVEDNEPIVGVISFPALNQLIYASKDSGCWFQNGNDQPVKIWISSANKVKLAKAVVSASGIHSTTFDRREGSKAYNLSKIFDLARDVIFINDSYQHIMVALGRIDAAIDTIMKPWDIAALIPCLREAGVVCSDMNGSVTNLLYGGSLLTASSQTLLNELIVQLNGRDV